MGKGERRNAMAELGDAQKKRNDTDEILYQVVLMPGMTYTGHNVNVHNNNQYTIKVTVQAI